MTVTDAIEQLQAIARTHPNAKCEVWHEHEPLPLESIFFNPNNAQVGFDWADSRCVDCSCPNNEGHKSYCKHYEN